MAEQPNPVAPAAPEPAPELTESEKLKALLRQHVQPVLIGVGLALAIVLAFSAYRSYKTSLGTRATQMLLGARNTEQLQQVITQYPHTSAAPLAMLALAAQYYDGRQYDMAQFQYNEFERKYPKHPMIAAAELGKAQCLEGAGQVEQAMDAFNAFIQAHPDHFLTPSAVMGKGRCLTQLKRFDEAKAVYEDFIAAHPKSSWASMAETAVMFVEKEKRAQEEGIDTQALSEPPPVMASPEAPSVLPGLLNPPPAGP